MDPSIEKKRLENNKTRVTCHIWSFEWLIIGEEHSTIVCTTLPCQWYSSLQGPSILRSGESIDEINDIDMFTSVNIDEKEKSVEEEILESPSVADTDFISKFGESIDDAGIISEQNSVNTDDGLQDILSTISNYNDGIENGRVG